MTAYTNHPDALFDPNKPILGSTHLEARDNLISLAEGDPTAPNIYEALAARLVQNGLGSWVFAHCTSGDQLFGDVVSGSALKPTGAYYKITSENSVFASTDLGLGNALSGSWKCLGKFTQHISKSVPGDQVTYDFDAYGATLWMRIA